MRKIRLIVLPFAYTAHRLTAGSRVPDEILDGLFYWIGKTDEELSIVCDSRLVVPGSKKEEGWSCLKVIGPLDFSLIGVLAGISTTLAHAGVSLLALSTFDTDYFLVKAKDLQQSLIALQEAGYKIEE